MRIMVLVFLTLLVGGGLIASSQSGVPSRDAKYTQVTNFQAEVLLLHPSGKQARFLQIVETRPLGELTGQAVRTIVEGPSGSRLILTTLLEPKSGKLWTRLAEDGSSWYLDFESTFGPPAKDLDSALAAGLEQDAEARQALGKFEIQLRASSGQEVVAEAAIEPEDQQAALYHALKGSPEMVAELRGLSPQLSLALEDLVAQSELDPLTLVRPLLGAIGEVVFEKHPSQAWQVGEEKRTKGRFTTSPSALELVSHFRDVDNNDPLPAAEMDAGLKRLGGPAKN